MFGWGRRGPSAEGEADLVGADRRVSTRVLARFVASLKAMSAPTLLDLGPVVGGNVAFLGERLGCKIFVEDFYAELVAAASEPTGARLADRLVARLEPREASIDGVLCWDLFDFLDTPTAVAVGGQLVRTLRPRGVLTGFFTARPGREAVFTRFVIADEQTLVQRPYRGLAPRPVPFQNRDLERLFPGLEVVESVLMRSQTRELLLRKPAAPGTPR